MTTLTRSDDPRGAASKGEWLPITHPVSGKKSAVVCCPGCGKPGSLMDHQIAADGTVSPSLICPRECGFHDTVKLGGWPA